MASTVVENNDYNAINNMGYVRGILVDTAM